MKAVNKFLLLAALANLVVAGFWSLLHITGFLASFLVGSAIFYIIAMFIKPDELMKLRPVLLILAIISIIFNYIAAIMIFVAINHLKDEDKVVKAIQKTVVDPEVKRIRSLLQLGVFMVLMAGIIFTTTTWTRVPDGFRLIFLLLLGTGFIGLSHFSEIKLKLKSPTLTYWLLGGAFYALAIISIGYFSIFGDWFAFNGGGVYLVYALLYLVIGLFMLMTYQRMQKTLALLFGFVGFNAALLMVFWQLAMPSMMIWTILMLIYFLIHQTKMTKNDAFIYLKKYAEIMSLLLSFVIMVNLFDNLLNNYLVITAVFLMLVNTIKLGLFDENEYSGCLAPIIIAGTIPLAINNLGANISFFTWEIKVLLILFFTSFLYTVLINTKLSQKKVSFHLTWQIAMNMIIISYAISALEFNSILCLIVGLILIFTNLWPALMLNQNEMMIEQYLQPFKVLLTTLLGLGFLAALGLTFSVTLGWAICLLPIIALYAFVKNEKLKNVYYLLALALIGIAALGMRDFGVSLGDGLIIILFSTAPFVLNELIKDYEKHSVKAFILMLINGLLVMHGLDVFWFTPMTAALISLVLLGLIAYGYRSQVKLRALALIGTFIPLTVMVENLNISYALEDILMTMLCFYLLYLLCEQLFSGPKVKSVIAAIGASFILLLIIFTDSLMVALYIALVALVLIIIGYRIKHYYSLFVVGIVYTVINILYQFGDLLTKVPFWAYLLSVGLALIGFVTRKELNKTSEQEEVIKPKKK